MNILLETMLQNERKRRDSVACSRINKKFDFTVSYLDRRKEGIG